MAHRPNKPHSHPVQKGWRERTREINKTKTKRRNKIQNAKEENKTRYYISNDKLKRNIFKTQRWVGLYPSITSKKKSFQDI